MPLTKAEQAERRKADREALAKLMAADTLQAQLAEKIREVSPGMAAGTVIELSEQLETLIAERESGYRSMEARDAHIEFSELVYPSGTVSLDAAGDLMGVEFNVPVVVE